MKTEKLRDSREVAAELEMRHDKLLRKLKGDKTHQGLIDRVQQQGDYSAAAKPPVRKNGNHLSG